MNLLETDIRELLGIMKNQVEDAIKIESKDYHILLLKRALTSISSSEVLVENKQFIDIPVLIRVVFEHICRLFLVNKKREKIFEQHKSAFQFMGKGPGPNELYKDFGEEYRIIYELLCSFAHPDLMGLLLNTTEKNQETIQVVIKLPVLSIITILSTIYPTTTDTYKDELLDHVQKLLFSLQDNIESFLQIPNWKEQFNNLKLLKGSQFFKREELNEEVLQFIKLAMVNEAEAKHTYNEKLFKLLNEFGD